jgi:hypothetical protein
MSVLEPLPDLHERCANCASERRFHRAGPGWTVAGPWVAGVCDFFEHRTVPRGSVPHHVELEHRTVPRGSEPHHVELEHLHEHTWSHVFLSRRGCSPIACQTCGMQLTDAQAVALLNGGDPLPREGTKTVEMSREELLRLLQDELQL